ncbi:MAG: ferritin family protein [Deltaproteobacteria bacterium]|nr:ferritin family protein [Deltaproteobacteria bacterium]
MLVFGTPDDVFAMAIRIKENGKAFYQSATKKIGEDPVLKKLFEDLAGLEESQAECFKSLRSEIPVYFPEEEVWDPEGLAKSYLEAAADTEVFTPDVAAERLKNVKTPVEALEIAIEFEKDSVHFLLGMKDMNPDPTFTSELDKLICQEMDHVRMLSEAKKTCRPTECEISS